MLNELIVFFVLLFCTSSRAETLSLSCCISVDATFNLLNLQLEEHFLLWVRLLVRRMSAECRACARVFCNSLLPKFDSLQTRDDYALEFQLNWIAYEQISDTLFFYFCRRGRRRCPEEIDPVIKWNRRTYVLNDNLAWLGVKNFAFHQENWSDMSRIASN